MSDVEHKIVDEKIADLETRLLKEYEKAYKEMDAKRKKFMASYEKQRVKMEKRYKSGEISRKEYRDWLKRKSVDVNWYRGMRDSLASDMNHVNEMAAKMINNELPEIYSDNMNYGTFTVEKGAQIDTAFTLVDRDTVYKLSQQKKIILPNVSIHKSKDVLWNRQKFNGAIMQSILHGESVDDAAKRLRDVIGMNYNSSVRSARTALTAAENMGRVNSYERAEELGVKLQKQWLATLDKKTRDTHRQLDGETIDVKDTFWNGLEYPGDPDGEPAEVYNCRCTLVSVIDKVDYSDLPRNSKLEDMTYEEWKYERKNRK